MKRISILFLLALAFSAYAQNYGVALPLDSTFKYSDTSILAYSEGIDSIPATGKSGGIRTVYSALEYLGRTQGSFSISFFADSVGIVGDTPYLQVYARPYYGLLKDGSRRWGEWNLVSFKKDTAFTSTTTYDSLTYDQEYYIQYKYDTYLKWWRQAAGIQYKIVTLDTLGVMPYISHYPR